MDRITSMTAFAAVAAAGSFAAAAQRLKLSPAAVTNHVRALEARLGARLLNRTTRKVSLTEAGRDYYERCTQILAQIEEADGRVSALSSAPRGMLRINASSVLCYGLTTLIGDFCATYPEIHVELIATDRMVDPVEEGFDLAIRYNEAPESSLIVRRLGQFRVVACAAPAYLERHGTPQQPQELTRHNCLAYMHPGFTALTREWKLIGPEGEVAVPISGNLQTNSLEAMRLALLEGRGIGMSQTYYLEQAVRTGALAPVLPQYHLGEFPIFALYAHRDYMPAKLRSFIDFAARHFAEQANGQEPGPAASRRSAA